MRYLVGFVFVVALVAAPLTAGAQVSEKKEAAEAAETPEPVRGVQRWHPDAFVDPVTGETVASESSSNFEIQYATQPSERSPKMSKRKRRIILGVVIPILATGLGLGIGAAVVMSNWDTL